jgi:thiol-disulfide isomerase/thioredoxin
VRIVVLTLLALGCRSEPARVAGKLELTAAPRSGAVAALLVPAVARAKHDGKHVLVYVGADWCEPCRKFHSAAKAGELDGDLGDLRLVEFDLDRDQERLEAAGYSSEFVPLFAVPRDDGHASGAQTDGIQKQAGGAVEQLVPRIRALVN